MEMPIQPQSGQPQTSRQQPLSAYKLILASSSPRRQAFFQALGLPYRVQSAELDETPRPNEGPVELVARLAAAKADAVAAAIATQQTASGASTVLIVAADTTVALGDAILNKPADAAEATAMLTRLRGQDHQVHSAIAIRTLDPDSRQVCVNSTTVTMRPYTDTEIAAYVATGDPLDKAGAYALQDPVFAPAACLRGCLASVVGLPLADLVALLATFGIETPAELAPVCEAQAAFFCCTRPHSTADTRN